MSRSSVEKILSHSTETFRRGTLQCFNNLGYSKFLCIEGVCHEFSSKVVLFTVPKNFLSDPSLFQRLFGVEKIIGWEEGKEEGGNSTIFCREIVVSQFRQAL